MVVNKVVNDSLPFDLRSDDHDRALACALTDPELKRKLLPTVAKLSPARQEAILAGGAFECGAHEHLSR